MESSNGVSQNNSLQRLYSARTILLKYANITKNHLFFNHVFTGYGKQSFIKVLNIDQKLRQVPETFMREKNIDVFGSTLI